MAFYKGFIPNFGRLGSWNVIMFLTLEQVTTYYIVIVLNPSTQTLLSLFLFSNNGFYYILIQAKKYVRELESSKK